MFRHFVLGVCRSICHHLSGFMKDIPVNTSQQNEASGPGGGHSLQALLLLNLGAVKKMRQVLAQQLGHCLQCLHPIRPSAQVPIWALSLIPASSQCQVLEAVGNCYRAGTFLMP